MLIRTLTIYEFSEYQEHLLGLPVEDRRMRFGCAYTDDSICAYVKNINPFSDRIFAVYGEGTNIVGVAHLSPDGKGTHELGLSVLPAHRGKGIGSLLFAKAIEWSQNHGGYKLFTHCLTENSWMMKKARALGMELMRDCGEAEAVLTLAHPTLTSIVNEATSEMVGLSAIVCRKMITPFSANTSIGNNRKATK